MKNENYIMLNGKRVDLTEEQIEKLGLNIKKDYFKRASHEESYYYIKDNGEVYRDVENKLLTDNSLYKVANYCTDNSLMQQRALYETLSRLLWRFSMQNDGDKIDWNKETIKYFIYFDSKYKKFVVSYNNYVYKYFDQHFFSKEIAQRAIDEIVLPFVKEHPDFVW